jgi:hypothetical protein
MKKIYNDIPLRSVLYQVSGLQKIKIMDVTDAGWWENGKNKKCLYEGLYKDMPNSYYRAESSKVHGIEVDDNTLVFIVCTAESD